MNRKIHEVDAQRARWLHYRTGQQMTTGAGDDFALGGLARYADEPNLRVMFLPADPHADPVPLDSDTLDWLKERRPTPYGAAPRWGEESRATSNALVDYEQHRDDGGGGGTWHYTVTAA